MKENDNREIAFFGKITAGISHEMQNVLAIINESTGLMEDFLNMSKASSVSNQKKLQDLLTTIQKQIQRGIDIARQLNRFSHEADEVTKEIDLSDITGQFVVLARRFTGLQRVTLKVGATNRSYRIITYPVRLYMVLFAGVECCLQRMSEGGQITLAPLEKNGRYAIHMVCKAQQTSKFSFLQAISKTDNWFSLQEIATDLGGKVQVDENRQGIFIFFPKRIP